MPTRDDLLKTLLDPERLWLLGLLFEQPASLPQLGAKMGLKPSQINRHLNVLLKVGVVRYGAKFVLDGAYEVDVAAVEEYKRAFFAPAVRPSADDVVARYVKEGRIVNLPLDKDWDRVVAVMKWLAEGFEGGRGYTEKELKELLAPHAIDHATLRRYLVDTGVFWRERGIYWKR